MSVRLVGYGSPRSGPPVAQGAVVVIDRPSIVLVSGMLLSACDDIDQLECLITLSNMVPTNLSSSIVVRIAARHQ